MIVVKVGGSLFDHPKLGSELRTFLKSLTPSRVLLVPGGGAVSEAVRDLDRIYALGEDASHWLAIRAMDVMGSVLRALINDPCITVLDSFAFARDDDSRPGSLPHSWDVTSDSIAARAAMLFGAARLLLLKSVDVPKGTTWEEAAQRGWVDAHFPCVMEGGDIRGGNRELSASAGISLAVGNRPQVRRSFLPLRQFSAQIRRRSLNGLWRYVPDEDIACSCTGDYMVSRWRVNRVRHRPEVAKRRSEWQARRRIPKTCGTVAAGGEKYFAIRADGHCQNGLSVLQRRDDRRSCSCIAEFGSIVSSSNQNLLAVGSVPRVEDLVACRPPARSGQPAGTIEYRFQRVRVKEHGPVGEGDEQFLAVGPDGKRANLKALRELFHRRHDRVLEGGCVPTRHHIVGRNDNLLAAIQVIDPVYVTQSKGRYRLSPHSVRYCEPVESSARAAEDPWPAGVRIESHRERLFLASIVGPAEVVIDALEPLSVHWVEDLEPVIVTDRDAIPFRRNVHTPQSAAVSGSHDVVRRVGNAAQEDRVSGRDGEFVRIRAKANLRHLARKPDRQPDLQAGVAMPGPDVAVTVRSDKVGGGLCECDSVAVCAGQVDVECDTVRDKIDDSCDALGPGGRNVGALR